MECDELIKVFTDIQDEQEMKLLFEEIFTPAEKKALFLRWELMKMLEKKEPQRAIASKLHISLCKITRGSKILKTPGSIAKKYIVKHFQQQPDADAPSD